MALPVEAIQWITETLRLDHCLNYRLREGGLVILKVPQLKTLWRIIRPYSGVRISSGQPEQVYITCIASLLSRPGFVDAIRKGRTIAGTADAQLPPPHASHPSSLPHRAVTAVYHAPDPRVSYHHGFPHAPFVAAANRPRPSSDDFYFPSHGDPPRCSAFSSRAPPGVTFGAIVQPPRPYTYQNYPQQQSARSIPPPASHSAPANAATGPARVRSEPGVSTNNNNNNSSSTPARSTTPPWTRFDQQVMSTLRQMGFTNMIEMEQAILANPNREAETCMMWLIQQREAAEEAKRMDLAHFDHRVMSTLRQMGFTNTIEMEQAIRANPNQKAETCMMWLIQQREEAEEAKQMDLARSRSEALRAEANAARKRAAKKRLESTSMNEWIAARDLFHGSVVLEYAKTNLTKMKNCSSKRPTLISFLILEKRILKWYKDVPWCYLVQLGKTWSTIIGDALEAELRTCIKNLESALYSLEEQQGGVPKIFLNARLEARKAGRPIAPKHVNCYSSSDEVIVLEGDDTPSPKKKRPKLTNKDPAPKIVIEIM